VTVREADAQYALRRWQQWPIPTMPDLPLAPWDGVPGCFWKQSIASAAVDLGRTVQLPAVDIPLETAGGNVPYKGFSYGLPYQLVDSTGVMTPALDKTRPVTVDLRTRELQWPTEYLPLPLPPDVVRREGDPTGGFDKHWMGYDPPARVLYEVIQLNRLWLADEENRFEWTVGYDGIVGPVARWDTSKLWNAPGQPPGVVATEVPLLPLIVRYDEYAAGAIDHAIFCVFPNYATEITGAARGGDGDIPGHPVRGGERLRLKEQFVTSDPISRAAHEFGLFCGDRNAHNPGDHRGTARFTITQDVRWQRVTLPKWQLSQFEVVVQ